MRLSVDSFLVRTPITNSHTNISNTSDTGSTTPMTNYSVPFVILDSLITTLAISPNFSCLFHILVQLKSDPIIKNWLYLSLVFTTCISSVLGIPIYMLTKTVGIPPLFQDAHLDYTLCSSLIAIYLCASGVLPAMLG